MRLIKFLFVFLCTWSLISCNNDNGKTLKVGTIAGPETQLMEVAKKVAKEKYGLEIKIIEFTDYVQPNAALNDGSLDANMTQHEPYLIQQKKDRHYKIETIGKTFIYPMGIYSKKIKKLEDLRDNAIVALPNDPSNEGRALLLLQKANLIELPANKGLFATPHDIQKNPKHLKFKELDAAQISRALPDVDVALINTNFAIPSGLTPTKDAIYLESTDSPYVNIIVARSSDLNDPRLKELVSSFQSQEVLEAAKKIFNDQAIAAW